MKQVVSLSVSLAVIDETIILLPIYTPAYQKTIEVVFAALCFNV